jgi:hypothetical protein
MTSVVTFSSFVGIYVGLLYACDLDALLIQGQAKMKCNVVKHPLLKESSPIVPWVNLSV